MKSLGLHTGFPGGLALGYSRPSGGDHQSEYGYSHPYHLHSFQPVAETLCGSQRTYTLPVKGEPRNVRTSRSLPCMPKEPITTPRPQPVEPNEQPVKDPQPYKDPAESPPGDPQEDRPMRDPPAPNEDNPRSWGGTALRPNDKPSGARTGFARKRNVATALFAANGTYPVAAGCGES
jgi:hypothetical protein